MTFILFEPLLAVGDLSIVELNDYYVKKQQLEALYQANPYDPTIQKLVSELCKDVTNHLLAMNCQKPIWASGYLERNDTQRNYHNMVYLKYLILRDNIQDQDISVFLKAQGEIAIDPITQKPFQWNATTRAIFIPLPEYRYLPAQIRSAVTKNPDIKNLQVMIPQRGLE